MARRKGYGQFCPVSKAAEVFAERWTPLVLRELLSGSHRFNDIRRGVPLMSPSLLSKRLKELEWAGLVERRSLENGQGNGYYLTGAGEALRPIIEGLGMWGLEYLQSNFERQDLDPGLLLWDVRRNIHADMLPPGQVLIHFEFPEQPARKRYWWLLKESDDAELDLCLEDPGYEVDMTVTSNLLTMCRVWLGDLDLDAALRSGAIQLDGTPALRLSFRDWIGLSPFAGMQLA